MAPVLGRLPLAPQIRDVTLANAPQLDEIVIDRSQHGDYCQITLALWLPISGDPHVEDAVNAVQSILTASARLDPAGASDTKAEP